jgi:hypothetical protein
MKLKNIYLMIFLEIFSRIFQEYFKNISQKTVTKVNGCGSCHPVCTHMK